MPTRTQLTHRPLLIAVVAAVCFALGRIGLAVGGFSGQTIAVWPAGGVALAAVLVLGRKVWPAVFVGALAALMAASGEFVWSTTIAIGYTLEAVVGAILVERLAHGSAAFTSARTIFRFVAIAVFVSTPLSAAYGVIATALFSGAVSGNVAYLWMSWWLANLAGILVVAPLTLVWATTTESWRNFRLLSILESLVILSALIAVALVVFGGRFPAEIKNYPLEFLCVPFLLWAAFRQGSRTVVTATAVLSGIAVWGTTRGFGPFAFENRPEGLVLVQAYMSVMAVTAAVVAAVIAEHRRAEARLRELATTDPLTGLSNYRRLLEVLRSEIARSNRTSRAFSVLFLDMDGLKRINDEHGHLAGSRALTRLADVLRTSCRTIDTPARFGGDEFAIVLPETPESGAVVVLDRINRKLQDLTNSPGISVSGGVAVFPRDGSSPTQLLRAADRLLYDAKSRTARRPVQVLRTEEDELKTGTLF